MKTLLTFVLLAITSFAQEEAPAPPPRETLDQLEVRLLKEKEQMRRDGLLPRADAPMSPQTELALWVLTGLVVAGGIIFVVVRTRSTLSRGSHPAGNERPGSDQEPGRSGGKRPARDYDY